MIREIILEYTREGRVIITRISCPSLSVGQDDLATFLVESDLRSWSYG